MYHKTQHVCYSIQKLNSIKGNYKMEQHTLLYGGKIPIVMYVESETFAKIEAKRGKESRSSFLNGIIEKEFKTGAC